MLISTEQNDLLKRLKYHCKDIKCSNEEDMAGLAILIEESISHINKLESRLDQIESREIDQLEINHIENDDCYSEGVY